MTSLPLHPVMVHLPLALAFLMPPVAALAAWAIWTRRIGARAWLAIVALQLVLVAASVVAIKTGEHEEDRVEGVVPAAALHQHEEYAEQFAWGAGIVLGLTLVVLVPAGRRIGTLVTLVGTIAAAALALRVGHAGGQLVYVHNAGAAYAQGRALSAAAQGGHREAGEHREETAEAGRHEDAQR